jgi:ABC-type Na+ efflux pump permease subunit
VAAVLLAVLCVGAWLLLGANRGWTRTSDTRMEMDPVTEIEFPVVEKRFTPGVELLAGGLFVSAMLALVSMFVRSKPN